MKREIELCGWIATIYQRRRTDDSSTGRRRHCDRLTCRQARGNDVLDHQYPLTRSDLKPSAQHQSSGTTFDEKSSNTKCPRDLMPQHDPTKRRGQHDRRIQTCYFSREGPPESLRALGVLQHPCTLQVAAAVKSRRKLKVAL